MYLSISLTLTRYYCRLVTTFPEFTWAAHNHRQTLIKALSLPMVQTVLLSLHTSVEQWLGVEMLPLVSMLEVASLKITHSVELPVQSRLLAQITPTPYGQILYSNWRQMVMIIEQTYAYIIMYAYVYCTESPYLVYTHQYYYIRRLTIHGRNLRTIYSSGYPRALAFDYKYVG